MGQSSIGPLPSLPPIGQSQGQSPGLDKNMLIAQLLSGGGGLSPLLGILARQKMGMPGSSPATTPGQMPGQAQPQFGYSTGQYRGSQPGV